MFCVLILLVFLDVNSLTHTHPLGTVALMLPRFSVLHQKLHTHAASNTTTHLQKTADSSLNLHLNLLFCAKFQCCCFLKYPEWFIYGWCGWVQLRRVREAVGTQEDDRVKSSRQKSRDIEEHQEAAAAGIICNQPGWKQSCSSQQVVEASASSWSLLSDPSRPQVNHRRASGEPHGVRHGYTTVTLTRTIRCLSELCPSGGRNVAGFGFANHLFFSKFNIIRCAADAAAPPSGENGCFGPVLSSYQRRSSENEEQNLRLPSLPSSDENMTQAGVSGVASKCKP